MGPHGGEGVVLAGDGAGQKKKKKEAACTRAFLS